MEGELDHVLAAKALAVALRRACTDAFESNLLCVLCADILAKGASASELSSLCQFLQLLASALRSYM